MNHIGDLFSKIKSSFVNNSQQKEIIIAAYKKIIGADITAEEIQIDRTVLKLSTSPAARSAVFMKKQMLLEEINKNLKPPLSDIR